MRWLFGDPYRLISDGHGKWAVQNTRWGLFGDSYWDFQNEFWTLYPREKCWTDVETATLWAKRFNA
jgi:hypothetical protein